MDILSTNALPKYMQIAELLRKRTARGIWRTDIRRSATVEATWAAYAALRRIPCSFIAGVVAADKEDRCPHDEALSRSAAATPIELNYAELLGQCSRLDLLGGWLTSVLVRMNC